MAAPSGDQLSRFLQPENRAADRPDREKLARRDWYGVEETVQRRPVDDRDLEEVAHKQSTNEPFIPQDVEV